MTIQNILFPGPSPRFRAVMDTDPEGCKYYINDVLVTKEEYDRQSERHDVQGSRTFMDTPDEEPEEDEAG